MMDMKEKDVGLVSKTKFSKADMTVLLPQLFVCHLMFAEELTLLYGKWVFFVIYLSLKKANLSIMLFPL